MCCGQKRATVTPHQSPAARAVPHFRNSDSADAGFRAAYTPAPPAVTQPDSPASQFTAVYLKYREQPPIRVRGWATGLVYQFSGTQSVQPVDERDAAGLLRTHLFRRSASPK